MCERAAIGLALAALCEFNISLQGPSSAAAKTTISKWKDLFLRRFGIPPPGPNAEACWANLQLKAMRLQPLEKLQDEPDAHAVARRATYTLSAESSTYNKDM